MSKTTLRRLRQADVEDIVADLSKRQYLSPRKQVGDVLTEVAAALGLTLTSVRGAADRLEFDPAGSIGRLKRADIEHLSRMISRVYRHELTTR